MKNINSLIFKKCQSVFASLNKSLLTYDGVFKLVSSCDDENDVILESLNVQNSFGEIKVKMYIEFFLGKEKHINPKFELNLDLNNQRAEVLGFESDLFPSIKLNVYSEINGSIFKNIIAEQDLEMLCLNWLKQLEELKYKPICKLKQTA